MLRKNVKSLLEQLQVCIFAEIVFGVRYTLTDVNPGGGGVGLPYETDGDACRLA